MFNARNQLEGRYFALAILQALNLCIYVFASQAIDFLNNLDASVRALG